MRTQRTYVRASLASCGIRVSGCMEALHASCTCTLLVYVSASILDLCFSTSHASRREGVIGGVQEYSEADPSSSCMQPA
jgi:hypothetical protein